MKPFVVLTTVLIISLSVSYLHADNLDRKVRKDVIAAAVRAKIEVDRSLINAFIEMGSHYPDGMRHVYLRVPSEKRVKRLAMYFKAKSGKCGFQKFDTPSYVGDFHWSYLSDDTVYSSFCLDSPRAAKLTKLNRLSVYTISCHGGKVLNQALQSFCLPSLTTKLQIYVLLLR